MAHTDGIKTIKANLQELLFKVTGVVSKRQTVSGVIKELADNWSASNGLPKVTSSDNGKVLKVVTGAWAKAAETAELPSVTASDNGKILGVSEGAWAAVAKTVELPAYAAADSGKVLAVKSDGTLEWKTLS